MKALITGAAGFAGSHLAEYLLDQNIEIIAMIRPGEEDLTSVRSIFSRLRVERCDLCDAGGVLRILRDNRPEHLYHLGAISSPVESFQDPRLTYDVNFTGTFNILAALRQLRLDCRVLYVSSSEVYGPVKSEQLPLHEQAPFRPASPYAGSKAAAELLTVQFFQSYGLPIVRARPFNHTGPRQSAAFVCSNFARQIAEVDAGLRLPSIKVGNLKVRRDFSDVRDIVRGYHLLLEKGEPGEVYHLGSGRSIAIEEILQILLSLCAEEVEVITDPSRLRPDETASLWGDTSKVENAVGWKAQYPLEQTLRDLKVYWQEALRSSPV